LSEEIMLLLLANTCKTRLSFCYLTEPKQAVRVATQYASAPCKLTISSYLFARWHLFRHVGYLRHQQQVDLWPFDLETGVRVTCDVIYLCVNFSHPSPFCSRVSSNVRDRRRTDGRQTKASLNASALWGRRHNKRCHSGSVNQSRQK